MLKSLFTQEALENYCLLYLTDQTCPICDVFWPDIQKKAEEFDVLTVKSVDKQSSPVICGQFLVFQFPTAILFRQGKEIKRFVGAYAFDAFEDHLDDLMNE